MKRTTSALLASVLTVTTCAPLAVAQADEPPAAATPAPAPVTPPPAAVGAPAPSQGAPSSESKAMAETLFFTGRGLMEAGRHVEACKKFDESYRLDPAAGTLLNLAVCYEKIGKIASAWGAFKQALFDAKKAGRADREELAKSHIDVLEPDLPYLTINVPSNVQVPGLEVVRNGSPLTSGGWGAELPVDPGVVEVVTRAPGYKPKTQTITIAKKEHKSLTVLPLEKAPVPVVVVNDGWTTRQFIGIGLIGAGVAGLAAGGYFGVRALGDKKKSDDACETLDGEYRCSAVGAGHMDDARRNAWISNIGIGFGVVSAAVGTYLFVTGARQTPEGKPSVAKKRLDWSVAGGPNGVSGMLVGSF